MKKKKINKNILKILRNLSKNDYKFFAYKPRNFEFLSFIIGIFFSFHQKKNYLKTNEAKTKLNLKFLNTLIIAV